MSNNNLVILQTFNRAADAHEACRKLITIGIPAVQLDACGQAGSAVNPTLCVWVPYNYIEDARFVIAPNRFSDSELARIALGEAVDDDAESNSPDSASDSMSNPLPISAEIASTPSSNKDKQGDSNGGGAAAGGAGVVGAILLALFKCAGHEAPIIIKAGAPTIAKVTFGTVLKATIATTAAKTAITATAEYEAETTVTQMTRMALEANPSILRQSDMAGLMKRYPGLNDYVNGRITLKEFTDENPDFIDSASVRLLRRDPDYFAKELSEQTALKVNPSAFDSYLKRELTIENEHDLMSFRNQLISDMAQAGLSQEKLAALDDNGLRKVIAPYFKRELAAQPPNAWKWSYENGSVVVTGKLAERDFKQEVSAIWLVKAGLVGTAAVEGKRVLFDKEKFTKEGVCFDSLCLNVHSNEKSKTDQGSSIGNKVATPKGESTNSPL